MKQSASLFEFTRNLLWISSFIGMLPGCERTQKITPSDIGKNVNIESDSTKPNEKTLVVSAFTGQHPHIQTQSLKFKLKKDVGLIHVRFTERNIFFKLSDNDHYYTLDAMTMMDRGYPSASDGYSNLSRFITSETDGPAAD